MEEKKLYPLGFCVLADEYGWGTDEFLLADLGYRDSLIRSGWLAGSSISELMDTYMDRVVGDNAFTFWGRQFPVQLKRIAVNGTMPLRVHPDTETAAQRYDFLGRRKLWYVLDAGADAQILAGWKRDTDASEMYAACTQGDVLPLLKSFSPRPGQYIQIPAGTPHAASGKLEILEISESSPLDFCLSGMGSPVHPDEFDEALNIVDAMDFIDYKAFKGKLESGGGRIADFPEFVVERTELRLPALVSGEADNFVVYVCASGSAALSIDVLGRKATYDLSRAKALLVPAECPGFTIAPRAEGTVLLQVSVPFRTQRDGYTAES